MAAPDLVDIILHKAARSLEVRFADDQVFQLPAEYLRVHSPSAEVQGHGPGPGVLVAGKQDVGITALAPIGHYALQITFSDGHDSGLFSFDYLYRLGTQHDTLWQTYLDRLAKAGQLRQP
ncbi:gamma-butyrobetaine hydroxylase-like domain-containing protein [Immundisolibacter sp.]|uniref:gamma-butyrobetaine hydroxylase-like domain-containing protein n=3 Tax=Immundisolibacter sp. TaxID=1934948 RepID=UPI0035630F6B